MSAPALLFLASAGLAATRRGAGTSRGRRPAAPHHPAPPARPQPKTNNKPLTTNNKPPLAPNIQPQAPISDEQVKSADEFFKLINPSASVIKEANGKITLKNGSTSIDITAGITNAKLIEARLTISDNLFIAIAQKSRIRGEAPEAELSAADPNNISFEELNIFLEENLKEFAMMQGETDLKALFQVYNNAKSFVRASDADKTAIDETSRKAVEYCFTGQPNQNELTKEVAYDKTVEHFGIEKQSAAKLIDYAAGHLKIDLTKPIKREELNRMFKFISFIPWLLKYMPETAKNSPYYNLPDWLKDQQGPSSLKDADVKAWYMKILGKKTEVAEGDKRDKENEAELQAVKANDNSRNGTRETRTTDKSADILKGKPA